MQDASILNEDNQMQRLRALPRDAYGKYSRHKIDAYKRGIPFLLTLRQWWRIWDASDHWHERGSRKGQYCMARYGDVGPYKVGNVRIITTEENTAERKMTPEYRAKISATLKGRKQPPRTKQHRRNLSKALKGKGRGNKRAVGKRSDESRRKMSIAAKNRPSNRKGCTLSKETKAKLRAANLGKKQSEETKAKKRLANLRRYHPEIYT